MAKSHRHNSDSRTHLDWFRLHMRICIVSPFFRSLVETLRNPSFCQRHIEDLFVPTIRSDAVIASCSGQRAPALIVPLRLSRRKRNDSRRFLLGIRPSPVRYHHHAISSVKTDPFFRNDSCHLWFDDLFERSIHGRVYRPFISSRPRSNYSIQQMSSESPNLFREWSRLCACIAPVSQFI
jgi:hypothetical protein